MTKKRVESVIFCDDIRQENTGKYIAIGVYSESYLVPSFPYSGKLSLLLTLNVADSPRKETMYFDLLPETESKAQAEFRFEIALKDQELHRSEKTIVATPQLPFSIGTVGNLLFREKAESGEVLQQFPIYVDRQPIPKN